MRRSDRWLLLQAGPAAGPLGKLGRRRRNRRDPGPSGHRTAVGSLAGSHPLRPCTGHRGRRTAHRCGRGRRRVGGEHRPRTGPSEDRIVVATPASKCTSDHSISRSWNRALPARPVSRHYRRPIAPPREGIGLSVRRGVVDAGPPPVQWASTADPGQRGIPCRGVGRSMCRSRLPRCGATRRPAVGLP